MDGGAGQPQLKEPTKTDWRKWRALTDYIVDDVFRIEPRWHLTIRVEQNLLDNENVLASTNWPNHYRSAIIVADMENVVHRRQWVLVLIHELCHLLTANMHDFIIENGGKMLTETTIDVLEEMTSEIGNYLTTVFWHGHRDAVDKWL